MQMRLDKFLAQSGVGTRSEIKKEIKRKLVTVNGITAQKPELKIDTDSDTICYAGKQIIYEPFSYYLFYKPAGCVTARTDTKEKTVMDYFPESMRKTFFPVGRLDKDTEGLLLVTNDGNLNHRLSAPSYHVEKTYYAILDTPVPKEAREVFLNGVDIGDDKPTLPAKLTILSSIDEAELTICEGRFHQVKRMFEAIGCRVCYLKRISFGNLTLAGLKKAAFRKLTEDEIAFLKNKTKKKNENIPSGG